MCYTKSNDFYLLLKCSIILGVWVDMNYHCFVIFLVAVQTNVSDLLITHIAIHTWTAVCGASLGVFGNFSFLFTDIAEQARGSP